MPKITAFDPIPFIIVAVIIGILVAIFVPECQKMHVQTKEDKVKANVRVYQSVVQEFADHNDGRYPHDFKHDRNQLGQTATELLAKKLNGDILLNPFTDQPTEPYLLVTDPPEDFKFDSGVVYYQLYLTNGRVTGYKMTGWGKAGRVLDVANSRLKPFHERSDW
jgi:type II secretory pathway pseudopilin PulG